MYALCFYDLYHGDSFIGSQEGAVLEAAVQEFLVAQGVFAP